MRNLIADKEWEEREAEMWRMNKALQMWRRLTIVSIVATVLLIALNVFIVFITKGWWLLFLGNTCLAVVWSIPCACFLTFIVLVHLIFCSTYEVTVDSEKNSPLDAWNLGWRFGFFERYLALYGRVFLGVCAVNLLCVHIVTFRDSTLITTALKGNWLFFLGNTSLVMIWSTACAIVLAIVGRLAIDAAQLTSIATLTSILLYVLVLINFAAAYIFSHDKWYDPLRILRIVKWQT